VILHPGPAAAPPTPTRSSTGTASENGQLQFDGILPIACRAADDSQFSGLAVFAGSLDSHLSGNRAGTVSPAAPV